MKKLSKVQKIIIGLIVVTCIIFIGYNVGSLIGRKSVKISTDRLQNLIDTPYEVSKVSENENSAEFNIIGTLSKDDVKILSGKFYDVGSKWNKKTAIFNFFEKSDDVAVNDNKFYTEGLINRSTMDFEKKVENIGEFNVLPSVDNAKNLNEYSDGSIISKDKNIIVSMNISLNDNLTDTIAQSKSFVKLFRNSNKDKDISSVELHLNDSNNDNKYYYNSDYDNILETVLTINH